VELTGLGAISDALVCRRRYDKFAEKKLLLKGSAIERDRYLAEWRRQAVIKVCETFELVKQAEQDRFGEKSFFRESRGLSPADADDDPGFGQEEGTAVHGFEESEVGEEEGDMDGKEVSGDDRPAEERAMAVDE